MGDRSPAEADKTTLHWRRSSLGFSYKTEAPPGPHRAEHAHYTPPALDDRRHLGLGNAAIRYPALRLPSDHSAGLCCRTWRTGISFHRLELTRANLCAGDPCRSSSRLPFIDWTASFWSMSRSRTC